MFQTLANLQGVLLDTLHELKIPYIITKRRDGDIDSCYADCSKANIELGWKAMFNISDACKDAWNFQLKNPNGYKD